jgi:DNA-binding IclR family transcriptional regulator
MSLTVTEPSKQRRGRILKTAVAVLQVLRMVDERGNGVTPEDVAVALDKSLATARYLLNSLCQEGYAYQDPGTGRFLTARWRAGGGGHIVPHTTAVDEPSWLEHGAGRIRSTLPHDRLREAVDELYGLTRHRSYLATADSGGDSILVQEMRGRQGLPTVRGLEPTIRGEAHALALGKALLAQRADDEVDEYIETYGLTAFTPRTIVTRKDLVEELMIVRRVGYAADREEYTEGICCLAVPIYDQEGNAAAALGISLTRGQIRGHQHSVLDALYRVAREVQTRS